MPPRPDLTAVAGPRLPQVLEPAVAESVEDHERWEDLDIQSGSIANATARGVEIVRTRLTDVDLSGAELRGLRLADCEIKTSNLANLMAIEGSMTRCSFTGCRMTGFSW